MKPLSLLLALLAGAALAEEGGEEWLALVNPTSTVEIGLGHRGHAPPAAGNALEADKAGTHPIGRFDLRGGDHAGSATRWRIVGDKLGLDHRELSGEYAEQGRFRLRFDHDRMPRFLASENYHTPFLGAGGTALSLPAGYPVANPQAGAAQIAATTRPFNIDSRRTRTGIGASVRLSPAWEMKTDFREDRHAGARATGATLGTAGNSIGMILPEPIDSVTHRFETSLAYQKDRTHLELAYRGSFFRNHADDWTFQNPFSLANTLPLNRMGTAPDNRAHLLSLAGGMTFGRTTRLTGAIAYGRQTQNETFLPYSTAANSPALPRANLDGSILTKRINLKLTSRPWRDLRLNSSFKFDSRDNRTPVARYTLPGSSAALLGEVGAANFSASNTPLSRRQTQLGIEGIYAVRPGSDLTFALQRENAARYCNGLPACVEVGQSRENSLRIEWRQDFTSRITGRLGYTGADRQGDDYRKYADSVELAGMRKFFLADRRRDQWRGNLHASLTETTGLGLTLDLNNDAFRRSPYGLQSARSRAFNLDLGHRFDDDFNVSLFGGYEAFRSRLANSYDSQAPVTNFASVRPDAQWLAQLDDTVATAGIALRRQGLLGGRLEIDADLVSVLARSPYRLEGGSASSSNGAPQALPEVVSRSTELRLNARYTLDEDSLLRLAYLYRRHASADFALDLYAGTSLTRLLGTRENAPHYGIHLLGIAYQHRFR